MMEYITNRPAGCQLENVILFMYAFFDRSGTRQQLEQNKKKNTEPIDILNKFFSSYPSWAIVNHFSCCVSYSFLLKEDKHVLIIIIVIFNDKCPTFFYAISCLTIYPIYLFVWSSGNGMMQSRYNYIKEDVFWPCCCSLQ